MSALFGSTQIVSLDASGDPSFLPQEKKDT